MSVMTNTVPQASLVQRSRFRTSSGFLTRWLALAVFCYLLSGQALASRDALGPSLAWNAYAESALFLASATIAWGVWAMHGFVRRPPNSFWLFLIVGFLALFSSVRSFWPALSVGKACLFVLVLVLAELLCNTFSPAVILRAIYFGIVSVYIFAILMGIAFPSHFPLTVDDPSGRHRLCLFVYVSGDYSILTGLGFLVGRLPNVRARWYYQAFLLGLTVASGTRATTCAVFVIWAASQMRGARHLRLRMGLASLFLAVVVLGILLMGRGHAGSSTAIGDGLQTFYGSDAVQQSPWELDGRVGLWKATAPTIARCAFIGFGFDGARDQLIRVVSWSGVPHNGFLDFLLAAGGPGLMIFLAGWVSAVRSALRSNVGRSTLAIHCFFLIMGITAEIFMTNQYFGIFLILCLHNWTRSLGGN